MNVTLLSSIHPRYLDATTKQVVAEEDEELRVVRSHRLDFVTADVAQAVLEISWDCITAPIAEVVCCNYSLLLLLYYLEFDCTSDRFHANFTTRELGAYTEGPIWTRKDTPVLTTLTSSFQACLALVDLQCAFPGTT